MRHIASTDASVTHSEAAAMVSGWFLTSTPALLGDGGASLAPAPPAGRSLQTGMSTAAVLEVEGRSRTSEEKLLADDRFGLRRLSQKCFASEAMLCHLVSTRPSSAK